MKSIATFFLLSLSTIICGKSDLIITRPTIDVSRAISIADSTLRSIPANKWIDFDIKEYVLMKIEYTTQSDKGIRKSTDDWFWLATFIHPEHTDHRYLFKIDMKGKCVLLESTE